MSKGNLHTATSRKGGMKRHVKGKQWPSANCFGPLTAKVSRRGEVHYQGDGRKIRKARRG